jgi:heme-degrading monooxygenase HmoA
VDGRDKPGHDDWGNAVPRSALAPFLLRTQSAAIDCAAIVSGDRPMYIAMNRFRVAKGSEAAFEQVWMSRDSYLDKVPGFIEFHLLRGPEAEDHTLYASHTIWANHAAFEAWTKSDAFRAAHHKAGDNKPLYLGHPQFEGFEVRQTVGSGGK